MRSPSPAWHGRWLGIARLNIGPMLPVLRREVSVVERV
jgi:hypothetical protein